MTYDVVVVGGGPAGTAAAIEAGRRDARTLVLEAFPEPGGAGALAGGGICLVGTGAQRERGIEDGVELALADWIRCGGEEADAAWARRYLEGTPELDDWLRALGIVWEGVELDGDGNSAPRWHRPRGGGGELVDRLVAATEEPAVDWSLGVRVTALTRDARGAVVGVEADGRPIAAGAVVVATGGFTGDPARVREHGPDPGPGGRLLSGGAPQATGSGHRLLAGVGAAFADLSRVWCYPNAIPDHEDPAGERGIVVRGLTGEAWVNADGRRFHDESLRGGATGTPALLAQRASTCWAIVDRRGLAGATLGAPRFGVHPAPDRPRVAAFLAASPYVHRAPTLEALAAAAGLPAAVLAETVAELNGWIGSGLERDPRFGRPLAGQSPIAEPPFAALRFFPLARKSLGGVRTDLDCRVLDRAGAPIAGLYAAGEVAGMAGGQINGRAALEGTMLGPSVFSGRVAGRAAADRCIV